MDTLQAIRERRAVKLYDPTHTISEAEQKQLIELAMLSPTSFNIQHWRIVNVSEPALRLQLRQAAWDQPKVTDASMLLLLCADIKAWSKSPQRYWANTPPNVQTAMAEKIVAFYQDNAQLARDEAIRSVGIMGQTIMLTAKAMGYDSCPMIGFESEKVATLINLPQDHVIGMMLAIGKPIQAAHDRPSQIGLDEALIDNHF